MVSIPRGQSDCHRAKRFALVAHAFSFDLWAWVDCVWMASIDQLALRVGLWRLALVGSMGCRMG